MFLFLPAITTVLISFFFPFTYWPEMMNWPWAMSQNWIPYKDISIIFTPLVLYLLHFTGEVVGFGPLNLRLTALILQLIINLILILITYHQTQNKKIALVVGILHAYLIMSFEANAIYPELLAAPLLLISYFFQQSFIEKENLNKMFFSGFFMALVLMTKQSFAYVLPEFIFFLSYLCITKHKRLSEIVKITFIFTAPIVFVFISFFLHLHTLEALDDFYIWAIKFVSLLPHLENQAGVSDWLFPHPKHIPLLLAFYILATIIVIRTKNFMVTFMLVWMVLSSLLIVPRFAYNHLLSTLSFFLLIIGKGLDYYHRFTIKKIFIIIVVIIIAWPICKKTYIESRSYLEPDIVQLGTWIKQTYPTQSLYILNAPEQLYFLSGKLPSFKPWIQQLPWQTAFYDKEFTKVFFTNTPDIIITQDYKYNTFKPKIFTEFNQNYEKKFTFQLKYEGLIHVYEKNNSN